MEYIGEAPVLEMTEGGSGKCVQVQWTQCPGITGGEDKSRALSRREAVGDGDKEEENPTHLCNPGDLGKLHPELDRGTCGKHG